jgi:hypothetical protein
VVSEALRNAPCLYAFPGCKTSSTRLVGYLDIIYFIFLVNHSDFVLLTRPGGETVDLPQIAVVGSQSSGKSSVLETCVCSLLISSPSIPPLTRLSRPTQSRRARFPPSRDWDSHPPASRPATHPRPSFTDSVNGGASGMGRVSSHRRPSLLRLRRDPKGDRAGDRQAGRER